VFSVQAEFANEVTRAIYAQVRCGFAHDGMFRNKVFFSSSPRKKAILITWPKKDGRFDVSRGVASIVINPSRFYECIKLHFDSYVARLRAGTDAELRRAFESAVKIKWGLDQPDPIIGMTEEEFADP
jgi:hypothetical protein